MMLNQQEFNKQLVDSQNNFMLNQQEFNKQLVDSQNNFMKSTCESLQSILVSLPTMMRQYAIEAQALNPAPLSIVAPQLMLTMVNSASAPSGAVLSPTPSAVTASAQVPDNVPSTPQSSDPGSHPEVNNVQEAPQDLESRQAPPSLAG